ncbi:MAG: amino acid ABC transporter substrate-binding protein [Candidatus Rokubacteria bacterium]|nr:amino acid ABC transporter substrate-binding protein [Candidatus Rokubacteria bacterium]
MRFARRTLSCTCLSLAAWLGASPDAEAQQPLKIGGSFSGTGTYARLGQTVHRGQQLCVKHANEKGGVLGRQIEFTAEDDGSDAARSVAIYERLLSEGKVDAVFSPFSAPITDAVAEVTEKRRKPLVACCMAATPNYRKGRKFLFMFLSPGEVYLEGLVDMAVKRGLKTIAVIHEDSPFPTAIARGGLELAKKRGLQAVVVEPYRGRTSDFSAILARVKAANPDVVAAATYFDDAVAITRQMKELDVNPRMYAATSGVNLPGFYERLGRGAEFLYGPTQWEPELVTLRAGGLVPIARQYPGAREFVESYRKEFPGADLSYQTAQGYGACQILLEGIRRAGSLDGDRIRAAILRMNLDTVFGAFKVDRDGVQIAHKMLIFQWQDGRKVIVWPEELAPGTPRFPTPPWSRRP